jgi:beta-aspartyl-peptidase (threonine type)
MLFLSLRWAALGLAFFMTPSAIAIDADSSQQIQAILTQQADAWNRGDIDAFMQHYWKSDELTFSAGGQTTRGWQSTKENYQRRYPTREKMGQLTFSHLEITPLGDSAALVLGRWRLDREPSPVGGNFSLVCRKIDGRWLIIHDHTSRSEAQ